MNIVIDILIYTGSGAIVGFLAGLLGVAGSGILVPTLVSMFSYRGIGDTHIVQMAVATALACSLPMTATSAYTHNKRGAVQWDIVKLISIGLVVGSSLGAVLVVRIDGVYLAILFSVFMFITAIKMFSSWEPKPRQSPLSYGITMLMGIAIGMISVLISVGGAFLSILYLNYHNIDLKKAIGTSSAIGFIYLNYHNIDLKKAIGTSSAIGFIAVVLATAGYLLSATDQLRPVDYSIGYVYLPAFSLITLASVCMVPVGTKVSHYLPNKKLKQLLGIVCVLLSVKMLISIM